MSTGIKAIVPVRSGSIRVANKNLAPFAGSNLLEIKVRQLLQVRGLDEVCVSSNDPEMLKCAESAGARVFPRDPYYASNTVPMSEVYSYMAAQMDSEFVLLTHVTNPLVKSNTYESAIDLFLKGKTEYDSLTTVSKVQEFLYRDGKALNYDPQNKPRSQDLPNIVKLNHAISILPRKLMIERKDSMGVAAFFMELSQLESFDVDTPVDFEIAEFLFRKYASQKNGET